jgi:ligand-binding sensor domain-containing protein/signal transduction histidine kinase
LGGAVRAIGQSPDGYLWIGTDKGLIRFDGFNFLPALPQSAMVQNDPIVGLMTDAHGGLWVRTQDAGVLRYSQGGFESVGPALGASLTQVTAISRENGGGVLLADLFSGIVQVRAGKFERLASARLLPGAAVTMSMTQTPDGKIWLGTLGAGLFYLENRKATPVTAGLREKKINCLSSISNKELWVGTDHGLFRWNGTFFGKVNWPGAPAEIQVLSLLQDRDSNVWVGTTEGLWRVNSTGIAFSGAKDFPEGSAINALFEDREGNLWAGGARGVERIRDGTFETYSKARGLSSDSNGPIYVDAHDRIWLGPEAGGLYVLKDGRTRAVSLPLLNKDVVYSITGRGEEVWIGRQHGGLTRLEYKNGNLRSQTYTRANGLAENSVYSVYHARDGAVWAGTLTSGASKLKDGRFITYTTSSGLASNTIYSIAETRDGTIWFATPNGLSALSGEQWSTYRIADGLPSDEVNCLFADSADVLWIGTSKGLAFFSSGHVQRPREAPGPLGEETRGIAEDNNGWLWITTAYHVIRLQRDKLLDQVPAAGEVREYGVEDGLESTRGVKRNNSVIADRSGKIWLSTSRGLSVVDPSHIADNSAPAMSYVEAISADNRPIAMGESVLIRSSHKRITLEYTGLSLAAPERVRFRYFLDGFDRGWSEPVTSREAVYTNLSPGSYRFRLVASNSDGLWNGPETSIVFEVEPALWQAWWFRVGCVLVAGSLMLFLYRLRLRHLTRQLNVRFEERLSERTRIAQELHDTLLQGVLSASMQLHVADDRLPANSPVKPLLTRVLELMGDVIDDGRNTLRGLRSPGQEVRDLAQAFSLIPGELGLQQQIDYRVVVEGHSRPLHPMIRDDVHRIGREALVNSFRHAQATSIRVEIEYGTKQLRVLVHDNGIGIDPQVLHSGREGHWGLSGMRERAERIGARLSVWSNPGNGTEVELSVPASIAFEAKSPGSSSKWLAKLYAGKKKSQSDTDRRVG